MRILFLESGVTAPEKFVYQCYLPHGLLYLASYLRARRPLHTLRVYDMMARKAGPEQAAQVVNDFAPDLVAIHAMSFQASCMRALAARIKAAAPKRMVAVGGPHPSASPEMVLADPNVDVVGIGEGEETFLEIVDRLEAGGDLAGIPGTAVKRGELVFGPSREFIADLDQLPFPAWDLVDLRQYFSDVMLTQNDITWRREVATIYTSRACPFRCIFCHNMFGKKFRARSVANVLAEMTALYHDHGIREFHIIDDCFNFDQERAKAILAAMVEAGLEVKIAFPNGIRADRLSEDLLTAMKRAGVYKTNFGVESGSPRIQKLIRKGIALEEIQDGIRRTAARGIFTHGFFMLGFPGETEEEMRATIDFACRTDLHTAGFALLSPFPGTEVYRLARESGREVRFDPDDTSYSRLTANLTAVDDAALLRLHRLAHWKFYGSPRRVARILGAMPHPADFFRVGLKHFALKFM